MIEEKHFVLRPPRVDQWVMRTNTKITSIKWSLFDWACRMLLSGISELSWSNRQSFKYKEPISFVHIFISNFRTRLTQLILTIWLEHFFDIFISIEWKLLTIEKDGRQEKTNRFAENYQFWIEMFVIGRIKAHFQNLWIISNRFRMLGNAYVLGCNFYDALKMSYFFCFHCLSRVSVPKICESQWV
jgi:hypothetical protein